MSVWGKIADAVSGLTSGSSLGNLFGQVAGHLGIDVGSDKGQQEGLSNRNQIAFTIGFIALSAKMAKADGVVTPDEVDAFKEVFDVKQTEFRNVERVFNFARQDVAGYDAYARQVANLFRSNPGILEDVLDGLFHIAKADGVFHENELLYLQSVAEIFGFSDGEFARIKASHLGPDEADPYVILGVDYSISDEDLRRAYRRLVQENHPDRLIARGVPEEFVELANEKLAAINAAYDVIVKDRSG